MVTHEGRVIYKVNQDRGLIAHPSLSKAQHTIFGIFDGKQQDRTAKNTTGLSNERYEMCPTVQ